MAEAGASKREYGDRRAFSPTSENTRSNIAAVRGARTAGRLQPLDRDVLSQHTRGAPTLSTPAESVRVSAASRRRCSRPGAGRRRTSGWEQGHASRRGPGRRGLEHRHFLRQHRAKLNALGHTDQRRAHCRHVEYRLAATQHQDAMRASGILDARDQMPRVRLGIEWDRLQAGCVQYRCAAFEQRAHQGRLREGHGRRGLSEARRVEGIDCHGRLHPTLLKITQRQLQTPVARRNARISRDDLQAPDSLRDMSQAVRTSI